MEYLQNGNLSLVPQTYNFSDDLLDKFIAFIDAKPNTIETYRRAVKQFFVWISTNNIKMPKREDIINYRTSLKARCKPSTVQNCITALKLFFRWTESERLYLNIAEHIKGAVLDRNYKKDYLTSVQLKAVLDSIDTSSTKGKRDYAVFAVMATGGLRTIEISRADFEDLRTIGDCEVLYLQGKGKEEKTEYIKIEPLVGQALRDYINSLNHAPDDKKPLFSSLSDRNYAKRLTVRSVSRIIKSRLLNAGLNSSRLTAHSLRHSAITLALLSGETLQEVQQFARHSNISTTQIYAHNLDRANSRCEAAIANAIFA
jgi:integrase/recombinase XerC